MGGALAEARAAWQRTAANRCCLVQEDAKRAPKLACCSSMPPTAAKPIQDVPSTTNRTPSYSPNSKWWLHLQPNYGYQKGLIDDQFNSPQANMELDSCLSAQTTYNPSRNFDKKDINDHYKDEELGEIRDFGCQVSKNLYFDSKSSEKNAPWWRTADTQELAYLVAQRSHELIENCDLPMPQNARAKKDPNVNICHFGHHEITKTPVDPKLGSGNHLCFSTHAYTPDSLILESACISVKGQLMSGPDKQWRDSRAHERIPVINTFENDTSKAKLLEALRHSQTRAREAEKAAKQAYSEKEHVVKLVFRQASQLFAYKQWLRLLQLENIVKRCSYNCTLDTSKN
ncbi:hypothetical protein ACJIZ3_016410 [Penstemon smallii]|uniref:Uncharacterized protein n=1 Tax=Penstemon smallii TaxID=265156 RepID=A0ABD3RQB5_9LAMI